MSVGFAEASVVKRSAASMIAGANMATHKRSSLAIAKREVKTKGVGFAPMQHWSDYAGNVPSQKQA